MLHCAALRSVDTLTVAKLKVFSAMAFNARHVLPVAVFCARGCGISSRYILVHVKNQHAAYRDAGALVTPRIIIVYFTSTKMANEPVSDPSRDLKEHLRRLQQQSDSRRRAAVMEMMRQRAAEVAEDSG